MKKESKKRKQLFMQVWYASSLTDDIRLLNRIVERMT